MSAITAHDAHAPSPDYAHAVHHELGFVRKYIFSFDHKIIGIQFLFSTLLWFVVGGALALAVRWQLAWPWSNMPIIDETPTNVTPNSHSVCGPGIHIGCPSR